MYDEGAEYVHDERAEVNTRVEQNKTKTSDLEFSSTLLRLPVLRRMRNFVVDVYERTINSRHEFQRVLERLRDVVGDRKESRGGHDDVEFADEVGSVGVDLAGVDGGDERREGHGLKERKRGRERSENEGGKGKTRREERRQGEGERERERSEGEGRTL